MPELGINGRGVGMGIGPIGVGNPNVIFKRKFRWTIDWYDEKSYKMIAPESYVKISARPNLVIEENNFLDGNKNIWIPGKSQYETISVTYLDTQTCEGGALFLYWLQSQFSVTVSKAEPATATLRLYGACGELMELWELKNAIVIALNLGEEEYSFNSQVDVEVSIRYDNAIYESNPYQ